MALRVVNAEAASCETRELYLQGLRRSRNEDEEADCRWAFDIHEFYFFAIKIIFWPISSLFRQMGSRFRQEGFLILQALRSQVSGSPSEWIIQGRNEKQKFKTMQGVRLYSL